jgi:DNA-directed RNA polymerase subunit RPC12/RpoP
MGLPMTGCFLLEEPMQHSSTKYDPMHEAKTASFEKIHKHKASRKNGSDNHHGNHAQERQFRCGNCGSLVSTDRELAGVNNRNHCPNCLWSKHVDLYKAGDRKASCGARMQPIGLTVKKSHKKYAANDQGELMLIHRCAGCGKISINRIASDDSTGSLIALYRQAEQFSAELLLELAAQGIHPLSAADLTTVFSQLFGWQSILEGFEGDRLILSEDALQQEDSLEE